ncbi:hypothetical protein D3C83_03060 [compost metagenome]
MAGCGFQIIAAQRFDRTHRERPLPGVHALPVAFEPLDDEWKYPAEIRQDDRQLWMLLQPSGCKQPQRDQ